MKQRLQHSRTALEKDQEELANRRQYVADIAKRLDEDKMRICNQREEYEEKRKTLQVDGKVEVIQDQDDVENQAPENSQVRYGQ